METQLQRLEVETGFARDDELAVDDGSRGKRGQNRRLELGEVPVERLQIAALHQPLRAVAEDQHTEPVPLRLVKPAFALG